MLDFAKFVVVKDKVARHDSVAMNLFVAVLFEYQLHNSGVGNPCSSRCEGQTMAVIDGRRGRSFEDHRLVRALETGNLGKDARWDEVALFVSYVRRRGRIECELPAVDGTDCARLHRVQCLMDGLH